jgi:hypothetical protein
MLLTGRMEGKNQTDTGTTAFCATIQSAYVKAGCVRMQINKCALVAHDRQGLGNRKDTARAQHVAARRYGLTNDRMHEKATEKSMVRQSQLLFTVRLARTVSNMPAVGEGSGAGFSLYSKIVSIRWISSLESVSCSAWRSSFICCWLVVPVNGSIPICMANRKMTCAGPVPNRLAIV